MAKLVWAPPGPHLTWGPCPAAPLWHPPHLASVCAAGAKLRLRDGVCQVLGCGGARSLSFFSQRTLRFGIQREQRALWSRLFPYREEPGLLRGAVPARSQGKVLLAAPEEVC